MVQKISQELIASKKQIFKDLIQELVSKQNQLHKYYELMKILAVAKPYMGEYAKAFELVQKLRLKQITHISHKDLVDSVREIWLVNGSPYGINPYIHNFVNDWFKHNYFKISHAAMLNLLKLHPLDEIDQSVHISDSEEQKSKSSRAIEHIIESNVNNNFDVVPTGFENLDATLGGGLELNNLHMIVAPTGCHAKGTKILMYDGRWKNVEDVVVGDVIMGDDSTPRNVLRLCRGYEQMYEIKPVKGKSFVVNENHILSLVGNADNYKDKICNISVKDYLSKSNNFKMVHKLYKPSFLNLTKNDFEDAYMIGVFIGDGSLTNRVTLHLGEKKSNKIFPELKIFADKYNTNLKSTYVERDHCYKYTFTVKDNKNNILTMFRELGIYNKKSENKFIPDVIKYASIKTRLNFIAGLLDTDGYLSKGVFDYITKSKILAEDFKFICNSVGLATQINQCIKGYGDNFKATYYRMCISGDCSIIPNRVKVANKRKQIKSVLRSGFTIQKLNYDNFYGFEIDGNNLYVMEDFWVTHNSGKTTVSTNIALNMAKNIPVCYMMSEQGDISITKKILGVLAKIKTRFVNTHDQIESLYLAKHELNKLHEEGKFFIYNTPDRKKFKMNEIRSVIENLASKGYKVFFIDNLNYIEVPDNFRDLPSYAQRVIIPELNSMTHSVGVTIILIGQVHNHVSKNKNFAIGISDIMAGQTVSQTCHSLISIHAPSWFLKQGGVNAIPTQLNRYSILKALKVRDGGEVSIPSYTISFGEYVRDANEQEISEYRQLLKQARDSNKGE